MSSKRKYKNTFTSEVVSIYFILVSSLLLLGSQSGLCMENRDAK